MRAGELIFGPYNPNATPPLPGWETFFNENGLEKSGNEEYMSLEEATRFINGLFLLSRKDGEIIQTTFVVLVHRLFPLLRIPEDQGQTLVASAIQKERLLEGNHMHPLVSEEVVREDAHTATSKTSYGLAGLNLDFLYEDNGSKREYEVKMEREEKTSNELLYDIFELLADKDLDMVNLSNHYEGFSWYLAKYIFGVGSEGKRLKTGSDYLDTILNLVTALITTASFEDLVQYEDSGDGPDEDRADVVTLLQNIQKIVELYNTSHEKQTQLPANIFLMLEQLHLNP